MNFFIYQCKSAWQKLLLAPSLILSIVSTMSLLLASVIVVFVLSYITLIKPLPYDNHDQLFYTQLKQFDQHGEHNVSGFNYPTLVDFYHQQQIFSRAALVDYAENIIASHPDKLKVNTLYITPEWFSLTSANLLQGRTFSDTENIDTNNPVALISEQLWRTRFADKKRIIGEKIHIGDQQYTVVGVVSKQFIEPALKSTGYKTDIWLPWDFNPTQKQYRTRWWDRAHERTIVGELLPTISPAQAEQLSSNYVDSTWQKNIDQQGYFKGWQVSIALTSFTDKIIGDTSNVIYLLVASVLCLLLIGCLNIQHLFFAYFCQQRHATSIEIAIGARRKQIFFSLFLQSFFVLTFAATIALIIANAGLIITKQYLMNTLPRVNELALSWESIVFTCVLVVSMSLVFSILSLRQFNFLQVNEWLNAGGKGNRVQMSQHRRKITMISQMAIAMILTCISSHIAFNAFQLISAEKAIQVNQLQSIEFSDATTLLPNRKSTHEALNLLRDELTRLPNVIGVSRSSSPFLQSPSTWSLTEVNSQQLVLPQGRSIDHQYFNLTNQHLIAGDNFTVQQVEKRAKILIINAALAKLLSPENPKSAIGMKLSFDLSAGDKAAFLITAVVSNLSMPGEVNTPVRVYRPSSSLYAMMIKHKQNQPLEKPVVNQLMTKATPFYHLFQFEHFAKQQFNKLFGAYITLSVALTVSLVSIILVSVGLFGIFNYSSQVRRSEIAIRRSLGATTSDIMSLIFRENIGMFTTAIIACLCVMFTLVFWQQNTLFFVISAAQLVIFSLTVIIIGGIVFTSSYLPIRLYLTRSINGLLREK